MSKLNLSDMMVNLYGPTATQMMGGAKPKKSASSKYKTKKSKGGASEKY
jgi:hypothetical protein